MNGNKEISWLMMCSTVMWLSSLVSVLEYCRLSSSLQELRSVVVTHGPIKGDDKDTERI